MLTLTCEDVEARERLTVEAGPQRDVVGLRQQVSGEPVSDRTGGGTESSSCKFHQQMFEKKTDWEEFYFRREHPSQGQAHPSAPLGRRVSLASHPAASTPPPGSQEPLSQKSVCVSGVCVLCVCSTAESSRRFLKTHRLNTKDGRQPPVWGGKPSWKCL